LELRDKLEDTWLYWYWGKEEEVEPDLPAIADFFTEHNVSTILDLGCGTGRTSLFLAKRGFELFGFDQSEKAIKRAKEHAKNKKLGVNFRVWNMIDFPYPYDDSFFSAVISTKVIHHTRKGNINKIACEISRITKDDGYLFLEVPTFEKLKRLEKEGHRYEDLGNRTVVFLEGEEKGVVHHFFTEEELLLTFSNYTVLDLHTREEHYCMTAVKNQIQRNA
jgi:SAM-dependent methyltransferase